MNVRSIALIALLGSSLLTAGCIQEADGTPPVDTGADSGDTEAPPVDTGTDTTTLAGTDLDDDGIADTDDSVVPYGDYVYLDQGLAASLVNTYLVGYGLGGGENEYDWCSENLPIERYGDELGDWPSSLQSGKVRAFIPDAVDILFGNLRTFEAGECDTSTDGGTDEWGDLTALNGHDEAVCPNPLDGNRLGLYLMKDEDGVFAPGCQGFGLPADENRDSDNDGDPDTTPDDGNDDGEEDEDGGDDGSSGSGDLVREVCVTNVSGDYDLGYLLMNDSSDTAHWVSDSGSTAVVSSPLLTESDSDDCATITLHSSGEQVKFNGWAAESTYWHSYFVGTGTSGDTCSGSTCAVGKVYVDSVVDGAVSSGAEQATISGSDLVWTD